MQPGVFQCLLVFARPYRLAFPELTRGQEALFHIMLLGDLMRPLYCIDVPFRFGKAVFENVATWFVKGMLPEQREFCGGRFCWTNSAGQNSWTKQFCTEFLRLFKELCKVFSASYSSAPLFL